MGQPLQPPQEVPPPRRRFRTPAAITAASRAATTASTAQSIHFKAILLSRLSGHAAARFFRPAFRFAFQYIFSVLFVSIPFAVSIPDFPDRAENGVFFFRHSADHGSCQRTIFPLSRVFARSISR